jgi:hypothetical protein
VYHKHHTPVFFCIIFLLLTIGSAVLSDEGMWTFDNPPNKQLQTKYDVTLSQDWLDHLRLSSVRFMDGGSGSFVSKNGLVATNHHVAIGQLQKMSSEQQDYVQDGFYAATPAQEIKCADLELNVLMAMENITDRIRGVVKPEMSEHEALKARKAEIARAEQEYHDKTGLTCNVVSLYYSGEYWMYQYKKHTDVRLVMAPERQIAFFGGDSDNFTYPRHDLDVAFFRVYENGKPLVCEHYLRWNSKEFSANELVFVAGHPGSTRRLSTYAQLKYQRDFFYPMMLDLFHRRIATLNAYAQKGAEQARRALPQIFGLENSKKAYTGEYEGLLEHAVLEACKQREDAFRKLIREQLEWHKMYSGAWDTVTTVMNKQSEVAKQQFHQNLRGSRLAGIALTIVRYVVETKKPDSERLDGFHASQLDRLKFYLLSSAPIYPDFEEASLAGMLQLSLDELGTDDPFIRLVLNGKKPEEAAQELIGGTQLAYVKARQELIAGGEEEARKSSDPLIALAWKLDPMLREREEWNKKNIESVLMPATEKIAQARFAVYGKAAYPDATFTLRLAYGKVKGYPMNGTQAPYKTTLYGLYDRALSFDRQGDYELPARFWERAAKVSLATPANFVSTCDITGGNSGSPVVNRKGEQLGIIFDGNMESLSGRFVYEETKSRAVAVHCAFIIEALRNLYDAQALADEIEK